MKNSKRGVYRLNRILNRNIFDVFSITYFLYKKMNKNKNLL